MNMGRGAGLWLAGKAAAWLRRISSFLDGVIIPPDGNDKGDDKSTSPPAGGFRPIKIRSPFGGSDREVRMIKVQGMHVVTQTCDDGPQAMYLITRGYVHTPSLKAFDDFVAAEFESMKRLRVTPPDDPGPAADGGPRG